MNQKRKADLSGIGFKSKTNFTGGETRTFSVSNSTTDLEQVGSIIERMMRPGKVFRLYRCFACNRCFPASKMSICLAVCRECAKRTQDKGRIARRNEVDRIANNLRIFLRGRIESI